MRLRLIDGMDYVEMDESMVGFNKDDQLSLILDWNNFKPEIRYCPTRASQINKEGKGYTNYQWEPIEGLSLKKDGDSHPKTNVDQRNKEDGMLPFRLSSYHNWMTWWRLHTAAFWSEKTDQSIGIYINDFEKLISGVKNIPCIYVDISEMEDNGYRVLEDITNTDNLIIKNMPIAIICKEGSMEQIRLAAGYDCVKDILFAPIEPQQLKRRIAAYRSKISD